MPAFSFTKSKGKTGILRGRRKGSLASQESKATRWRKIGKRLLLVLAFVLTVLPALFVASPISYAPPIAYVLLVGISWLYMQALACGFSFDEDSMAATCVRGEKITFKIGLKNATFLAHPRLDLTYYVADLFGGYDSVTTMTTTLAPKESCEFSFNATFAHLGTYSAGLSQVTVHDLLGLFTKTIVNEKRHYVNVTPRVFDVENVNLSEVTVQESKNQFRPIITDDMDYAGVREYQLGDPMKTVHWNLSSRNPNGDLYTRLFEVFANPSLAIFLDPYAPSYSKEGLMSVFDGIVESAVSVNELARTMGVDSSVTFLDRNEEPSTMYITSTDASGELIKSMKSVEVEEQAEGYTSQPIELLRAAGNSVHGCGNLAFCTSRLGEELLSTLVELKMRRRNPLLLLSVPSELEDKERKEFLKPLRRLEASRVTYYIVESNENGTEVSGL